jgi:cell filamentation protein
MEQPYSDNSSDSYVYPDSGVLKNIPNIRDAVALQTFEQRATALRYDEAMSAIKDMQISLAAWQLLHRILFQDVYVWAGDIRTVQLAKGKTVFAMPEHILRQAHEIFGAFEKEIPSSRTDVLVDRLAYYFAELNVLHPFREGNGRTQKMLFDEMTRRFGYEINWANISTEEFLDAVVAAYDSQDYSKIQKLFRNEMKPIVQGG